VDFKVPHEDDIAEELGKYPRFKATDHVKRFNLIFEPENFFVSEAGVF
jgi:hypothetical protein